MNINNGDYVTFDKDKIAGLKHLFRLDYTQWAIKSFIEQGEPVTGKIGKVLIMEDTGYTTSRVVKLIVFSDINAIDFGNVDKAGRFLSKAAPTPELKEQIDKAHLVYESCIKFGERIDKNNKRRGEIAPYIRQIMGAIFTKSTQISVRAMADYTLQFSPKVFKADLNYSQRKMDETDIMMLQMISDNASEIRTKIIDKKGAKLELFDRLVKSLAGFKKIEKMPILHKNGWYFYISNYRGGNLLAEPEVLPSVPKDYKVTTLFIELNRNFEIELETSHVHHYTLKEGETPLPDLKVASGLNFDDALKAIELASAKINEKEKAIDDFKQEFASYILAKEV